MEKGMESITINPTELSELLELAVPKRMNILITGAPGIGKSDIVAQTMAKINYQTLLVQASIMDPTDITGFPAIIDGVARFVPFSNMRKIIDAQGPLCVFFDDIGQAPRGVQAPLMQVLLARYLGEHPISDHVSFVAATNRRIDRAGVDGLLEPVKSRFKTIVELAPNLDDFTVWAINHNMPIDLISFLRWKPDLLSDFKPTSDMTNSPSPRGWAAVGEWINNNLPAHLEYPALAGAIGAGPATEFVGFRKIYKELPSPDAAIMNPDTTPVPDNTATRYAMTGAISIRAKKNNFGNVIKYANRLGEEFSILTVKLAVRRDRTLVSTNEFMKWASINSSVII